MYLFVLYKCNIIYLNRIQKICFWLKNYGKIFIYHNHLFIYVFIYLS